MAEEVREVLRIDALAFEVGGVRVLNDVSFALNHGEWVAVMGPSGCGKTTLLRCINRLAEPTEGRVLVDGADATAIPPVELRRRIGMVRQIPFMFAGTVRQNLERAAEQREHH